MPATLAERTRKSIENYKPDRMPPPDSFNQTVDAAIAEILDLVYTSHHPSLGERARFKSGMMEVINGSRSSLGHLNSLSAKYKMAYNNTKDYQDILKQELKASRAEKFQFYIFRTLTLLTFVGIMLWVGSFSQKYQIPFPMMRLFPVPIDTPILPVSQTVQPIVFQITPEVLQPQPTAAIKQEEPLEPKVIQRLKPMKVLHIDKNGDVTVTQQ
jgi:hypothetical protein